MVICGTTSHEIGDLEEVSGSNQDDKWDGTAPLLLITNLHSPFLISCTQKFNQKDAASQCEDKAHDT